MRGPAKFRSRRKQIQDRHNFDVIVVGAGPAGLSAALVLGRCRRNVLVFDGGEPRNAASKAIHGFLSRDGISPRRFLRIARQELTQYNSVRFVRAQVDSVRRRSHGFDIASKRGRKYRARFVVLATGLKDELPKIQGMETFYGRTVHHCPYCDGWEHRDQPLVVLGSGKGALEYALELTIWSKKMVLCTNGAAVTRQQRKTLSDWNIPVHVERVERLEGSGPHIKRVVLEGGFAVSCRALFLHLKPCRGSVLGERLGCAFNRDDQIKHRDHEVKGIPGLYVAGNACEGRQLVVIAVANGTEAAFSINEALHEERIKSVGHGS